MQSAKKSDMRLGHFDPSPFIKIVRASRCLFIRLNASDYYGFLSRADLGRPFTMAVPLGILGETRVPTLCFIFGDDYSQVGKETVWAGAHVGVLVNKRPLTAIEQGIKIVHCLPIEPPSFAEAVSLITESAAKKLADRLSSNASVVSMPPDLSARFVSALATRKKNHVTFRRLARDIKPTRDRGPLRLVQADAIDSALQIFGLKNDAQAAKLKLSTSFNTELSGYWLREDSVIEHDARSIPEFELTKSHVTGRAVFRRGSEVLEVITANRRPLERVLGVDLIYHNVPRRSLVMVQYKMLDPAPGHGLGSGPDWIYRPDKNLKKEINRMKAFVEKIPASRNDYRLNPHMFYLKFVRRDKIGSRAAITLPLEHFEKIPKVKGPRGARRVSYRALNGAYLRDEAFFGLIRAGYIGCYSTTTAVLLPLIEALILGNRAVVIAIQNALPRGT
jgi:hypothetical protein